MMSKSSTEYYNLEKVAEVLSIPTAEVNRLREQSKLRGFRDGTDWKFLKEEVHNYLAASIKARGGNADNGRKPSESDFDILGSEGSASSFDLLVENAPPLPDDDQLVAVSPQTSLASDLDLAALDNDDELALAEETRISAVPVLQKGAKPKSVSTDDDSDAVLGIAPASKSNAVLLDDNESVLGASGSSPQLGLAGDSGFDVLIAGEDSDLVAVEDSDLLQVEDEKTSTLLGAEDFDLEPSAKAADDDSESSSQVIAIDGIAGSGPDVDPFGQADFGASDFGSGFDSGFQSSTAPDASDSFGGTSPFPETFTAPTPSISVKKQAPPTEEYSSGMLMTLIATLVVMLLPGIMLIDMMSLMWSWDDPFVLNSFLMNMIAGWFSL